MRAIRWDHLRTVLVLACITGVAIYVYASSQEWGRPLGPSYRGPEVEPRPMTPRAAELGPEETATIEVFQKASRSVVFVMNTAIRRDRFSLNLYEVPQGSGSGFIWNPSGHIVTNFHVIYGADALRVILADQSDYPARVVGADPDHDLAVLQIQAPQKKLIPIDVGRSRELQVGQKVLAIGNPFGLDHSLTTGVVSALGRTIQSMTERTIEGVIQTDAAINPGNSGGPLLDSAGRVIGINTLILSPSGVFAGIGFAVPVDTINRVVPQLIRYGRLIRAGIGIAAVPDAIAARWGITGVIVGRLKAGGPAERAGLQGTRELMTGGVQLGDVIKRINDEPVKTSDDLYRLLDRYQVGDQVSVEYEREGRRRCVTVTLQAME